MSTHEPIDMPQVTIGMPVFNDIQFIESSLKSILKQTRRDFILIISDDGSTDGSADICKKYALLDNRIIYIRQPVNIGISRNMKFLLDQATTEYFMWAADDDLWSDTFVESLIIALTKNTKAIAAFGTFVKIDENDNEVSSNLNFDYSGSNAFVRLLKLVRWQNDIFGYGLFVREKIADVNFPVWCWPNKRIAYNNIYPSLCYYLAKGEYLHLYGNPIFFSRVKTGVHVNHKLASSSKGIWVLFSYYLRRLNLVFFSSYMILKGGNIQLAVFFFPIIMFRWFALDSLKASYWAIRSFFSYKK